jgi:hypothetical protein
MDQCLKLYQLGAIWSNIFIDTLSPLSPSPRGEGEDFVKKGFAPLELPSEVRL